MVKKNQGSLHNFFSHTREISLVFLGIGLIMFLLNISGLLTHLPESYSHSAFNISVFSSMLIIIYATYVLSANKKEN